MFTSLLPPFPFIHTDEKTDRMFRMACGYATQQRIVLIQNDFNRMELKGFAAAILSEVIGKTGCHVLRTGKNSLAAYDADPGETDAIIFDHAELLPRHLQEAISKGGFGNYHLLIAVVAADPKNLIPRPAEKRNGWTREFDKLRSPVLLWPQWNYRPKDHPKLVEHMQGLIGAVPRADLPLLHESAWKHLRRMKSHGTDDVMREIRIAHERYFQDPKQPKELTDRHFRESASFVLSDPSVS